MYSTLSILGYTANPHGSDGIIQNEYNAAAICSTMLVKYRYCESLCSIEVPLANMKVQRFFSSVLQIVI